MCVHDYGQGPCERHFSCAGCSELLRLKGEAGERAAAKDMLRQVELNLEVARAEQDGASYGAGNWVEYNRRLTIDLVAMLAIDDDPDAIDGELVRVWPEGTRPELLDA